MPVYYVDMESGRSAVCSQLTHHIIVEWQRRYSKIGIITLCSFAGLIMSSSATSI